MPTSKQKLPTMTKGIELATKGICQRGFITGKDETKGEQ